MQDARDIEDLILDDSPWFKSYEFATLWEQAYYIVWSEEDADDFDKAADFRAYYLGNYPKHLCFDAPSVGYFV